MLKLRLVGGKRKERMNRMREMENGKEKNLQLLMLFGTIRMKDCSNIFVFPCMVLEVKVEGKEAFYY